MGTLADCLNCSARTEPGAPLTLLLAAPVNSSAVLADYTKSQTCLFGLGLGMMPNGWKVASPPPSG